MKEEEQKFQWRARRNLSRKTPPISGLRSHQSRETRFRRAKFFVFSFLLQLLFLNSPFIYFQIRWVVVCPSLVSPLLIVPPRSCSLVCKLAKLSLIDRIAIVTVRTSLTSSLVSAVVSLVWRRPLQPPTFPRSQDSYLRYWLQERLR